MEANERKKLKFGLTPKEFLVIFIISEFVSFGYQLILALRSGGDVPDEIGRLIFGLVMTGIVWLIYLAIKRRLS
jgi:hypothetical protein